MEKYSSKIVAIINKEQKVMNGNLFFDKSIDNLPRFINNSIKPASLMKEVAKKGFNIDKDYKGNICGDCKLMLYCPKVRDEEKKVLNKYPFITEGLEVILCDNAIRYEYLKALEEYNKLKDNKDFFIDDYGELNSKLQNNGIDVALITVFKCNKFIPDDEPIKIKESTKNNINNNKVNFKQKIKDYGRIKKIIKKFNLSGDI